MKRNLMKIVLILTFLTCTTALFVGNIAQAIPDPVLNPNYNLAYRQMWSPNSSVSYTDNVFTLAPTAAANTVYGNFNNNHNYTAQFDMQLDANANAAEAFKIFIRNYQSNLANQNNGYALVFSPTSLALYGNSGTTAILKVASGNLRDNVYRNYKIEVNDIEPVTTGGNKGIEIKVYIDSILKIDYTFDGVLANYIDRTGALITATPPPNGSNSAFQIYSLNVGARIKTPDIHEPFYLFEKKNDFDYAAFEDINKPELATINLSDKELMDIAGIPASATLAMYGNTFEYSNSSGWGMYSTKTNTHTNFQTSFGIKFPSGAGLDAGRFRMVLRGSENIYGTYGVGYGLLVNPTSIQILKRNRPYGQAANPETSVVKTFQVRSLNATSQYLEIQVYNRPDGSVVINLAVNGMTFQYVDDGSDLSLLEHLRYPLTGSGVHGLVMASGGTVVVTTAAIDTNIDENFYAGKADNWDYQTDSHAVINAGELTFPKTGANGIFSISKLEDVRMKFNLSISNIEQNGFFAVALKYNTQNPSGDFLNSHNGYIVKFYNSGFAIEAYGQTMASKYPAGMNLANGESHSVYISMVSAINSNNLAVSVDGESIYYNGLPLSWEDGYMQMCSNGADVTITAEQEGVRNFRVLFVGNSITQTAPNTSLGWDFNWGLGVPKESMDYVHLVMSNVTNFSGFEKAEFMLKNIAAWERAYATYDIYNNFADMKNYEADIIIMRIAENANGTTTAQYKVENPFEFHYRKLIGYLNSHGRAKVILTTSYWGSTENVDSVIDRDIVRVAREDGYPLVRLGDLGSTYANTNDMTADEQYYDDHGYGSIYDAYSSTIMTHPGINGMKNIADRIWESLSDILSGGQGQVQKFYEIADGFYAEGHKNELTSFAMQQYTDGNAEFDNLYNRQSGNTVLFKLYNFTKSGNYYNLRIPLNKADARFSINLYTLSSPYSTPVALAMQNYIVYQEGLTDPYVLITGQIEGYLAFYIDVNLMDMFNPVGTNASLTRALDMVVLNYLIRNESDYLIDLSKIGNCTGLTLSPEVYPAILSSHKKLLIKFSTGTSFEVDPDVFEIISLTTDSLYFSIIESSAVQKNHAQTVATAYGHNILGGNVYNIFIKYNNINGNALTVSRGITVNIPMNISEREAIRLKIISSELPVLSFLEPSKTLVESYSAEYQSSVLNLEPYDFGKSYIFTNMVEELELISLPDKLSYEINEAIDITGLKVNYVLSNNPTEIAVENSMITGFDTSNKGTVKLTFNYEGLSLEFDIEVVLSVSSVTLKNTAYKTQYQIGEALDVANMTLLVTFTDSSTEEIAVTADMVTDFNTTQKGEKTFTIQYEGANATFDIEVVIAVDTIYLKDTVYKKDYKTGEQINVSGMKLIVTFTDGTTSEIDVNGDMISGYDKNKEGQQTIKITYGGKETQVIISVTKTKTGCFASGLSISYIISFIGIAVLMLIFVKKKVSVKE